MFSPIKKLSKVYTINPPIAAGIYTAGFVVGGLITLADFFESVSGVSEIINIAANDNANQKALLNFMFFKSKPAGTYADSTAFTPTQADLNLIGATAQIPTAAYVSATSNAFGDVGNIRKKIQATKATLQLGTNTIAKNGYLVIFTSSTPNYAAVNALQIEVSIEQDV